jgi:CheY-like chemotaxis protein
VDSPVIQHWLVSVARAAKLSGADNLDVPSSTDVGGAWDVVAAHTGVGPDDLAERVAAHYRLGVADLDAVDPHAGRLLPAGVARKLHVVPMRYSDRILTVATSDPVSMEAEREISHVAGRTVHFEVASPAAMAGALERMYPSQRAPAREIPPLEPGAKGGPLVLVVDDDGEMRALLRSVLEERGFRVIEASDGREALDYLAGDRTFSLVILDLYMKEVQGLDVLKHMRSQVRTATLPVVVATGSDDPAVEMELFEAGADDFVVKPVDPPRFMLRVQAVLRRREGSMAGVGLGLL